MISSIVPTRRVRRLSLRAHTAELAQHSAIVLSDALHTATIPEADQGRLVVIRRLDLGRIDPNAVSSTLALRIEQVSRSVIMNAQPADSPLASTASAVVFRDYTEAAVLLTRRVAAHQSTHEWFWLSVFPEWKDVTSQSAAWQFLLDLSHNQDVPLLTVSSVVREAIKAGAGAEIAEIVSVANVAGWLRRTGLDPSVNATQTESTMHELQLADPGIRSLLDSCIVKWGYRDLRSFWLTAVLMIITRPSLAVVKDLAVRVRAWLDFREESESSIIAGRMSTNESENFPWETLTAESKTCTDKKIKPAFEIETDGNRAAVSIIAEKEAASSDKKFSGQTIDITENQLPSKNTALPRIEAFACTGEWSGFGGLFFLVPILERLGIREFLEKNPILAETAFPQRFLLNVGKRIGLLSSDPLTSVLMNEQEETIEGTNFQLTPILSDFLSLTGKHTFYNTAHDVWLKAVRRWSRLEARMGLITLIRRPGLVLVSQVQLDICFDLDQTDVRLRRQALDVDPGWVPWLGRIIRFHYGETSDGY